MEVSYELVGFDYLSASYVDSIRRVLWGLYSTPAGTCAGDRSYGIDQKIAGLPVNLAENQLSLEIIEKTAAYEPRVEILDVSYQADYTGLLRATVRVGPNEEYTSEEVDAENV